MSNPGDFIIENDQEKGLVILKDYKGTDEEVRIPDGVTAIGTGAFSDIRRSIRVIIPDSVTRIGGFAFTGCSDLISVVIPGTVKKIPIQAFSDCGKLETVTICEGVEALDGEAFANCKSLKKLSIPASVKTLGKANASSLYKGPFIGSKALEEIALSEGLTNLENKAFEGCVNLKRLTIPDSVTTIDKDFLPKDSKVKIAVSVPSKLPAVWRPNAAVCFAEDGGEKSDARYASHCKYIKSNARKLVDAAMQDPALLDLMCREKLIGPGDVDLYTEKAKQSRKPGLIAAMEAYTSNKLSPKERELKKKEQENIANRRAQREGRTGIEGLSIVALGKLETIDNREDLKACIAENGGVLSSSVSAKTDLVIMNDPNATDDRLAKAKNLGIEIISERQFNDLIGRQFGIWKTILMKYCGTGGSVVIPEGITEIAKDAFKGCAGLKNVSIPESIQSIGESAFSDCGLTEVVIPRSVKQIGKWAFFNCPLEKLILEEGIQSFDFEALYGCKPRRMVIPETLTKIKHYDWTFYGIGLVTSDLNRLPASARWEAAICFAEDGGERTDPRFENHIDFLRSKVTGSAELAAAHPPVLRLMCREKLIGIKSVPAYLKAVQAEKNTELIALMLDYQNELRGEKKNSESKKAVIAKKSTDGRENRLFEGQVFAVAGKLNTFKNKSELKSFIVENGGEFISSLTDKVKYLILNDPEAEKDKADQARALGAQILSERELNEKVGRIFLIVDRVLRRYCGEDADVKIPTGVSEIGQKAFYKNLSLKSVEIPAGVTKVGVRAFAGCENLTIV